MMKFFRKHNKKLLAIFMVLLMVVFLGGSALDTLLRPSGNRSVATSRLGPISYLDQQIAQDTTKILSTLAYPWQQPIPGASESLEVIDWILLTREAKRMGLGSNLSSVRATLPNPETLTELSRNLRVKPSRLLQAIAEFQSVREAARTVGIATTPSLAEVQAAARKTLERLRINVVMLPAELFRDDNAEFSEAQMQAQFEKYRQRERGPGLSFGYYVPPALKVQYIKIDRDVLAKYVRVPNLERKARSFYDKEREQHPDFRRTAGVGQSEGSGTDKADATTDEPELYGPPLDLMPYLTWGEAKEKALENVRRQEADGAVARLADWIVQYAAEAWLDVERGKDGYKTAPPSVAKLSYYDELLTNIPATIAYPQAVSTHVTDFFTQDEADQVPGLGDAYFFAQQSANLLTQQGGVLLKLRDLAFRTKAIVPKVPEAKGTNPADYLAMFQTCRIPLRDGSRGDLYAFRVVDARPAHIPESIDEVRDQVVKDLRTLRAYQEALARAEALRSCEESGSLEEAYQSDDDLVARVEQHSIVGSGYLEPPPFARTIRFYATGGGQFTRTPIGEGVGAVPPEVTEALFALTQSPEKVKTVELKDRATVMVAEWVETQRPKADEFDAERKTYYDELARNRSRSAVDEWLNPENIRARNGFALITN